MRPWFLCGPCGQPVLSLLFGCAVPGFRCSATPRRVSLFASARMAVLPMGPVCLQHSAPCRCSTAGRYFSLFVPGCAKSIRKGAEHFTARFSVVFITPVGSLIWGLEPRCRRRDGDLGALLCGFSSNPGLAVIARIQCVDLGAQRVSGAAEYPTNTSPSE